MFITKPFKNRNNLRSRWGHSFFASPGNHRRCGLFLYFLHYRMSSLRRLKYFISRTPSFLIQKRPQSVRKTRSFQKRCNNRFRNISVHRTGQITISRVWNIRFSYFSFIAVDWTLTSSWRRTSHYLCWNVNVIMHFDTVSYVLKEKVKLIGLAELWVVDCGSLKGEKVLELIVG